MSPVNLRILIFVLAAVAWPAFAQTDLEARIEAAGRSHPRLFLKSGEEAALRKSLAGDSVRAGLWQALLAQADRMAAEKPVERILTGRRLLDKSRTCLSRVLHWGLAWRLTGERKYAERARTEMLAAASFSDWNPSHFLDVAEMTAALGIGYDWFHAFLDEPSRKVIREALVEKGLKPSLKFDHWTRVTHNWNQVCNGGITVGALAVAEHEPELAARLIRRAIETVPLAMHDYAPDGAYPEGASYWSYGTSFNILLISALESALGTDFGLTRQPGFLASADYRLHVFGPTGQPFEYSDVSSERPGLNPAMFWMAARRGDAALLWTEWPKLETAGKQTPLRGDRFEAFLPLWLAADQSRPTRAPALSWTAHGITPLALHRTGWDRDAVFVGIKGGSPATNHAHMDVGVFVVDADGVRWADDLGRQDYNSLESKGIDLWGKGQDAERWKVFRLGTSAHSVPMVDGGQQRYESKAPILVSRPGRTVVDLSQTYAGSLADARRGIELRPDRTVVVQDEYQASGRDVVVRWAMVTRAEVEMAGAGRARLSRGGKRLEFRVVEPAGAALKIYATDPPPRETDAPNPGTRILGFEAKLVAGEKKRVVVRLTPQSAAAQAYSPRALADW